MAVNSALIPLGTSAPDFSLPDLTGIKRTLASFRRTRRPRRDVLVQPLPVRPAHRNQTRRGCTELFRPSSSPSVVTTPTPTRTTPRQVWPSRRTRAGWKFPYLVDADQTVAQAYGAVCTPDFFVYGPDRRLAYRGAFDQSTPSNGHPLDGSLLVDAVHRIASGQGVPEPHRPSMGCSIKWKPGMQP